MRMPSGLVMNMGALCALSPGAPGTLTGLGSGASASALCPPGLVVRAVAGVREHVLRQRPC